MLESTSSYNRILIVRRRIAAARSENLGFPPSKNRVAPASLVASRVKRLCRLHSSANIDMRKRRRRIRERSIVASIVRSTTVRGVGTGCHTSQANIYSTPYPDPLGQGPPKWVMISTTSATKVLTSVASGSQSRCCVKTSMTRHSSQVPSITRPHNGRQDMHVKLSSDYIGYASTWNR